MPAMSSSRRKESHQLLEEFRMIVEGTPQIKSEVYESFSGLKEVSIFGDK